MLLKITHFLFQILLLLKYSSLVKFLLNLHLCLLLSTVFTPSNSNVFGVTLDRRFIVSRNNLFEIINRNYINILSAILIVE